MVADLTPDERRAINSLKRLAKRWPKSLMLFGGGGLTVRKPEAGKLYDARYIVATIDGIPADGGDGGIEYPGPGDGAGE